MMRKIILALALVVSAFLPCQAFAPVVINIAAGASTSAIQSAISGSAAGDTIQFAAGSFSITSGITLKCGVTYTGVAVGIGKNGMATQTTVLSSTMGSGGTIFTLFSGGSFVNPCTQATAIEFFSFMGSGGIDIQSSFTALSILHNNFGNLPCCSFSSPNWAINFDGAESASNTAQTLSSTLIQWNTIGDSNSCTASFADTTSADGDGNAGQCGGISVNTTINGLQILNNNFFHLGEPVHINCPGGSRPGVGESPCEPTANGVITSNITAEFNDFSNAHRINWEEQPQSTSGVTFAFNDIHDMLDPVGFSFGLSFACCSSGGTSPFVNVSSNVILFNTPFALDRYGFGIEAWGFNGTYNNNMEESNFAAAPAIAYGCGPLAQTNNNLLLGTGWQGSFIVNEGSEGNCASDRPDTTPGQMTGNVTGTTITTTASALPSISPSSGGFSGSQVVTFTDAGFASGAQPLGNTGVWVTTDGSTPTPGSGTAQYIASGGTITVTSTTTVKAVGMWGAINQPPSYASGFGFVPSAVVTAVFTGGGTPSAASPVASPAGETFSGPLSVALSSTTAGSNIFFTVDGTTPTASSTVYTGPITISATTTLQAIATAPGFSASSVSSQTYTLAAAPTLQDGFQGNATSANTLTIGAAAIQQTATGEYSDSSEHTLPDAFGNTAAWTSSNASILNVTSAGLVSCVNDGQASSLVTAQPANVVFNQWVWTCSGTPVPTLSGATISLQGIQSITSIPIGSTAQACVNLAYTNPVESTQVCGSGVDQFGNGPGTSWSSLGTGIITSSPSGLLSGVQLGNATIVATVGSFHPSLNVSVTNPTLTGGVQGNLTPPVTNLAVGSSIQQVATGEYSDGVNRPLPDSFGNTAVWSSSNAAILTVSSTGRVTCVAAGQANTLVQSSPGAVQFSNWGWTCSGSAAGTVTIKGNTVTLKGNTVTVQ
jgi:hypothetical protein